MIGTPVTHSTFTVVEVSTGVARKTVNSLGTARGEVTRLVSNRYTSRPGSPDDYEIREDVFETRLMSTIKHLPVNPKKVKDPLKGVEAELPVFEAPS